MKNITTKHRGDAAEDAALDHLQDAGLVLVARNYRTPGRGGGEIDLIVRDPRDGTLVFVEVRQRSTGTHGGAGGSITGAKQRRIVFAARHYLNGLAHAAALPLRRGAARRTDHLAEGGIRRRVASRSVARELNGRRRLHTAHVLFHRPPVSSRPMLEQRIQQHFIDSADLKYQAGPVLSKPISQAMQAILACVTSGGKVLACGAGVSGLLAAQFAAQFVGRFERERPELGAIALAGDSTDPAADSANAVDADRFARQVRALGQAGDVLLVLSASGQSASVLAAVMAAHERDMTVVALLGNASIGQPATPAAGSSGTGGAIGRALRETDVQIGVSHERAARIHEVHLLALHCLCDGVDAQLLGEQEAST
jgi:D-sedoheptulose 7-phosphate isomerase